MLKKYNWSNIIFPGLLLLISPKNAIADHSIPHVAFRPPADDPQPQKTAIGGRRTNDKQCSQASKNNINQPPLTALVPVNKIGLTTNEYPTFWVYIPETSANKISLSIMEQQGNQEIKHYSQTFFSVPPKSGLVALKLSDNSRPLEIGKTYKWAVILICGKNVGPNDPMIEAWISRINLTIPNKSENLVKKADLYGKQGIWYDFLESFSEAKQANPNNQMLISDWTAMLKLINLESLSSATSQP